MNFNRQFKSFIGEYGGVCSGAVYGLLLRLIFNLPQRENFSFTDLFSVTFIWIVPFAIGMVPMFFASERQLGKSGYRIFTPSLTVFLFFLFCFTSRAEDFICILIISAPFILAAMLGGSIIGILLLKYRQNRNTLYSVLLIPFICGMIEEQFKIPSGIYHVNTITIINSTPQNIWQHVIRVDKINANDYHKGFFNYVGIPQPLYAELNKDTIGATRIGHFEGGLKFIETVDHWERNKKVSFNIAVSPSTIRNMVFDKHILMGNHFKFVDASYTLRKISSTKTELILSSSYRLDTRINVYASFWGNALLSDFQQRLLDVIKQRCEN